MKRFIFKFILVVACRKRPVDADSEFDSAMRNIFQILMNVSRDFLFKSSSSSSIDESEYEFAEYVCESMVSLGSFNLQCVSSDSSMLAFYLQQVTRLCNCVVK